MQKKQQYWLLGTIALLAVGGLVAIPNLVAPTISSNWLVVYNKDRVDVIGAEFIKTTYGAKLTAYDPKAPIDLNSFGQSLIWIGGSAGQAESPYPWLQPKTLAIQKPTNQPAVQWVLSGGKWYIQTSTKTIECALPDKDYGTITVGYDLVLQRYVVVVIGYSACASQAGASLICKQGVPITSGHYMIYRYTGEPVALTSLSRSMSAYPYVVVETG